MNSRIALCAFLCAAASASAADIDIDPLTTRWTFGAHEPYTMYRRVGRHCTGGIDGNASWVKDWLDWWDEHAPEKMEEIGLNFLHSRFYKGMGWETEKKDFPNVRKFVRNCHRHGVKALAYVQFGTLYPETLQAEIPDIESWASVDRFGRKNLYGGWQYFRWMPCLTCGEWEDYIKRMCTIALTDGGFDGIMFDNVFDLPCYCSRCLGKFREHLAKIESPAERFGFDDLRYVMLPGYDILKLENIDAKDPVLQAWALWRCDLLTGMLMRLRRHIKSVKRDAIVSGNPSPYRAHPRFIQLAQNMAELCKAFDFIVMQNENFPSVLPDGKVVNRVRDLKYAQDMGQRIVALCDADSKIIPEREANFLLPMVEDVVFGGIPTDRTVLSPSTEEGFVDSEVFARRKAVHAKFNAFVSSHREALSSPTVHSVRIFYPEREVLLSEPTHQGVAAAEEIFLRNRVPYGYLVSYPDDVLTVPDGTEVIVAPGLVSLSDAQIAALVGWAKKGGKLVVTGDAGRYDDWNAQRRKNVFLPQLSGLPNVAVRAKADIIPNARVDWRLSVLPPEDGGRALMEDLAKVGWRPPVRFTGMPPHVFAEYRQMSGGRLAVHLVNYDTRHPVENAGIVLGPGEKADFEEPLAEGRGLRCLTESGRLPSFAKYAIVVVTGRQGEK